MGKRIMGIDVGTAIVGWGVIETANVPANKLKLVEYGTIITKAGTPMSSRLERIYDQLGELLQKFQPDEVAVESLFFFKNQTTVMSVSQARGVIMLAIEKQGIVMSEYTPLQVKGGVTGYGRADKAQVQRMVKVILGMREIPKPDDAADAIAIAIAHINTNKDLVPRSKERDT
jgi:crossover junction endodeoxyribonuclease RuvC